MLSPRHEYSEMISAPEATIYFSVLRALSKPSNHTFVNIIRKVMNPVKG